MFGDCDWPLSTSRSLSAIAEFLVSVCLESRLECHTGHAYSKTDLSLSLLSLSLRFNGWSCFNNTQLDSQQWIQSFAELSRNTVTCRLSNQLLQRGRPRWVYHSVQHPAAWTVGWSRIRYSYIFLGLLQMTSRTQKPELVLIWVRTRFSGLCCPRCASWDHTGLP